MSSPEVLKKGDNMAQLTDIEIAQACEMKPIGEIAQAAGIDEKYIEQYGRW